MEKRKVPLLDLGALHQPIRDEVLEAIRRVVDSNAFILGEDVRQLEKSIAAYCHVRYAVGCGSGSDALLLAMMAAGVGPGDAVLTTPFTFFATAGSIVLAGATPVFVDIDPATYNMDPQALADTIRRTPRAKAVIPVHLYGACADMDPILEIARARECVVIEDGAQAIGAEYRGHRAQSLGDMGCLSFYPTKNLGAFGEGGMVLTEDERLAQKLAALRVHGAEEKYLHRWVGLNSRLDTLQAAVLRVKMQYLDGETAGKRTPGAIARRSPGCPSDGRTRRPTKPVTSIISSRSARRSAIASRRIWRKTAWAAISITRSRSTSRSAFAIWATARAISPKARRPRAKSSRCRCTPRWRTRTWITCAGRSVRSMKPLADARGSVLSCEAPLPCASFN
jgi:hypothetical protein